MICWDMLSFFHVYVIRDKPSRWLGEGKARRSAGSSGYVLTHKCYILGAREVVAKVSYYGT